MSSYVFTFYEVFNQTMDYYFLWGNTFASMPKTQIAQITINYHNFVGEEFDIQIKRSDLGTLTNIQKINYCTFTNDSVTFYYFVDVTKNRISEGAIELHLVKDLWISYNLNSGCRAIQKSGHASQYNDFTTINSFITEPRYFNNPYMLSVNVENPYIKYNDTSYILGSLYTAIIFIYKLQTSVVSVVKLVAITDLSNIWGHILNGNGATEISIDGGTTFSTCEPIKLYVIPPCMLSLAFINRHLTTSYLDVDIKINTTTFSNFASELYVGETWTRNIYIDREIIEPYKDKTFTQLKDAYFPLKYTVGFLGQTYEIPPNIINPYSKNEYNIYTRCIVGTDNIVTQIKALFTNDKWEDTSSCFEEVITYSEYNQWLSMNRYSISTQRTLNLVNLGIGAIGAIKNPYGLVGAIGNIASFESNVSSQSLQTAKTLGNQGGLSNLFNCYGGNMGIGGLYLTFTNCNNATSVLGDLLRYGLKYNTTQTISTSHIVIKQYYDLLLNFGGDFRFLFNAPFTSGTNNISARYIEGILLYAYAPTTANKTIPEIIKKRFESGCYVFNIPPT